MSSAKFSGRSGVVVMIAPLPSSEINESPYMFEAKTLAYTLAPQFKLNGDDLKDVTGIVHVVSVEVDISQLIRSTEN